MLSRSSNGWTDSACSNQGSQMESRLCNFLSAGDFLDLDGPTGMAAEPWEPRECFFKKLGLDEKRRTHWRIFRQMLREAIIGRTIVLQSNVAFSPSITASDVPEDMVMPDQVLHDAMRGIYDAASPQSKAIYDLVTDQDGYCWILQWTLRWALSTSCETCQDRARRDVSMPSKPNHVASDRVDSASPDDHTRSARKRTSPLDGSQHDFGTPVKRQKVKDEAVPLLLTQGFTEFPSPMSTKQRWMTRRSGGRRHMDQTELRAHNGETELSSPESGHRTPMSLSSMLNPGVFFQE